MFEELFSQSKFLIQKSDLQKALEMQGHVFQGQESLTAHELNPEKPCYCGRPVKRGESE